MRGRQPFTGRHMFAILAGFFGVVIAVNFTMASYATSTFGGVVVENSYVASQEFNRWLDQAEAQEALGWSAVASRRADGRIEVAVTGPEGGLPPEAVAFIREHKTALLAALEAQSPSDRSVIWPDWLPARYRRVAIEAGSITWRDQAMLWPAEVYQAWHTRAASLEQDGGLSRDQAEARAYLEYRQHNIRFPIEEPEAEGRGHDRAG